MKISALGINAGKIKQFNSKGIETIEDLVRFLPLHYYDFRIPTPIRETKPDEYCSILGKVTKISEGEQFLSVSVVDEKKGFMQIVWFHQNYLVKSILVGEIYHFCGKIRINEKFNTRQMINPLFFSSDLEKYRRIIPVYPKIPGMSSDYLSRSINTALAIVDKAEDLEDAILRKFDLMEKAKTLTAIHQPETMEEVDASRKRLLFEDLWYFAKAIRDNKVDKQTSIKMMKAASIKGFVDSLPFTLTEDQLQTTRSIFKKFLNGERVHAIVQGDVGSGKTIIAFILMLIASENNYQSVLMAPTNVLAKQHYQELSEIGMRLGYEVGFLSGEMKPKERAFVLKGIKNGTVKMIVGTHAVLSEGVEYRNLGLTIVDEEHRFGVLQRQSIGEKTLDAHRITMSATPIPRSLALAIYGEGTDVYNITQMPKGRKKIETTIEPNILQAYEFVKNEVKKGRQGYVVCPLIDKSEAEMMQGVMSVQETYQKISDYYQKTGIRTAMISGDMKEKDIAEKIRHYASGEIDVLVSTTIIEVGVNVPNASVMMVQNAERFGLSQLHQLRGRVGRGEHQSYCLLVSEKSEDYRLNILCQTTNGFRIAEADLKLRGSGDFLGTVQSGDNKYVLLMLANQSLFEEIKKVI